MDDMILPKICFGDIISIMQQPLYHSYLLSVMLSFITDITD